MAQIIRLPENENYQLPEGALCLSPSGWGIGELHQLGVQLRGINLADAINQLSVEHSGLLGKGELLFVTHGEKYVEHPMGRIIDGYVVFVPADD